MKFMGKVATLVLVTCLAVPGSAFAFTAESGPTAPERMTTKQAGNYYLDWACWINAVSWRYYDLVSEGYTATGSYAGLLEKKYQEAASKMAAQSLAQARALKSPPKAWPKNVVKYVNAMIEGRDKERIAFNKLATATDEATITKYINKRNNPAVALAAKSIRALLNLPTAAPGRNVAGCEDRGSRPAANSLLVK